MKNILIKILNNLIKPFYGSGIGKYPPFYQINNLYKKISKSNLNSYETKYGFKMFLDGSNLIDKEIIFNGYWEKNISELIIKNLKEGETFLDLGANIGYFTLLSSKIVGDKGKILSFEPSSLNYKILEKNIQINNFKNIDLYKLGVGKDEAKFEIFFNNENPGATSIIKTKENINFKKETVKIIKLDNFIKNQKIDFIKMDIEGFEFEAILGMKEILEKNDIKMIFEYSPKIYKEKEENYKEYSISLLNELNNLGYKLFHIEKDGNLIEIINNSEYFVEILNNEIGQSDIFCIKK